MELAEKKIKYPENTYLEVLVKDSGKSVKHLAKQIPCSRKVLSDTIHGHYKGTNIIPKLTEILNK